MRKALLKSLVAAFALPVFAQPVLWSGNGHYYELVGGNITWNNARNQAEGRLFNGMHGHLATITSGEENSFIASQFAVAEGGKFAWIGGQEPADDGKWFWVVGPEAGIQFSDRKTPTAPFFYANWGGIEPNDNKDGEDYLMLNLGPEFAAIKTGQWADAIDVPNVNDPVLGYIVEYEITSPVLSIRSVDAERVEISFQSIAGQRYQVQSKPDLNLAAWPPVGNEINGDGSRVAVTETVQPGNMFYRVVVELISGP